MLNNLVLGVAAAAIILVIAFGIVVVVSRGSRRIKSKDQEITAKDEQIRRTEWEAQWNNNEHNLRIDRMIKQHDEKINELAGEIRGCYNKIDEQSLEIRHLKTTVAGLEDRVHTLEIKVETRESVMGWRDERLSDKGNRVVGKINRPNAAGLTVVKEDKEA